MRRGWAMRGAVVVASALVVALRAGAAAPVAQDPSRVPTIYASDAKNGVDATIASLGGALKGLTNRDPLRITWEELPASVVSPNDFPPDWYTQHADMGISFATIGQGRFRVSASGFTEISPSYAGLFFSYSGYRIFAPLDGNAFVVQFAERGTNRPAMVRAFGAVFTGVNDPNSTTMEFFHGSKSLAVVPVPVGTGGTPTFAGAMFPDPVVTSIEIKSSGKLGDKDVSSGGIKDVVALDDLVYEDPVPSCDMRTTEMRVTRDGDVITYASDVLNQSGTLAEHPVVTQTIPPDVHVMSVSPTSPIPTVAQGLISWVYEKGTLPPGYATTFTVVVGADRPGFHASSLTATAWNDSEDVDGTQSVPYAPSACASDATFDALACRIAELASIASSLDARKSLSDSIRAPLVKAGSLVAAAQKRSGAGKTAAAKSRLAAVVTRISGLVATLRKPRYRALGAEVRDSFELWTLEILSMARRVAA